MSNKYTLLTSKGICMNFLLELKFFILSHPVTSKQPQKIVQILLGHPVFFFAYFIKPCYLNGNKISRIAMFYHSVHDHCLGHSQ